MKLSPWRNPRCQARHFPSNLKTRRTERSLTNPVRAPGTVFVLTLVFYRNSSPLQPRRDLLDSLLTLMYRTSLLGSTVLGVHCNISHFLSSLHLYIYINTLIFFSLNALLMQLIYIPTTSSTVSFQQILVLMTKRCRVTYPVLSSFTWDNTSCLCSDPLEFKGF